jgi:hypothetical protein
MRHAGSEPSAAATMGLLTCAFSSVDPDPGVPGVWQRDAASSSSCAARAARAVSALTKALRKPGNGRSPSDAPGYANCQLI